MTRDCGLPPRLGMNREQPNIACPVKDRKAGHHPVFKAVLIYENFAAGVHARRFFEALARSSDKALEEQMWNFEVLGIREARNAAASAARKAEHRLQFQCIEEQQAYYLIGQRPNLRSVLNRLRARTSWHL